VLHPVGDLPAHVYWRRRVVVLVLVLGVLGGAGWLGLTLLVDRDGGDAAASDIAVPQPALERVVPSLSAVATPDPPPVPEPVAEAPAVVPEPVAGGPCTDDVLGLEVRAPASAALGSKPTFEIAVANLSAVPCVRALDKGLEEIVMLDAAGNRVWGSNDCFPETGSDLRTLAPGEVVVIPLVWGGLTSEPTCTAPRDTPAPGTYLLRARLDTKVSADASIALG
jgi:hypothetical protein